MIPIITANNQQLQLTPGDHSRLIKAIIEEFAPRFVPGARLVYVGDTGDKWGYSNPALLAELGIKVDAHGKMPDVVLYDPVKNWLILIESVTSHGPVDPKRHQELMALFAGATVSPLYVTAFPTRQVMKRHLAEIAWETEV